MTNKKIQVLMLVLLSLNLLLWVQTSLARKRGAFDQLGLLTDIRYEIVNGYVEEPDEDGMVKSAVRGMIDSLNDPYTTYLSEEDLEDFDKHVRGSFSGIGAEVMIDPKLNRLKIVSPLEESPAWKAGVMAGDVVLEIDGKTTEGIKITEAVDRLTGPEGTKVTILVRHESGESATIEITRARINIQTVKGFRRDANHHWDFLLDKVNKVGYVRLTQFTERTADELREAVEAMKKAGAKALIMDVRFNPGGLLTSAVAISDMFLPEGKTIVSVKGRKVQEQIEKSTGNGTAFDGPMVIIANEASASASEIVAGALKDNGRARFVGARTFGKGSVQQLRALPYSTGALKMTNAYYYIPSGTKIHRIADSDTWGVDPDEGSYVPMSPQEIKKMVDIRREGDVLKAGNGGGVPDEITPEWIEENLADLQLAAALKAIRGKLADDKWPVVGKDDAKELAMISKRETLIRQREIIQERLTEIEGELAKIARGEMPEGKIENVEIIEGE